MTTVDDQWDQTTALVEDAFKLFDGAPMTSRGIREQRRATLMIQAAQASATLMLVRENRITNLLAAAYAPAELQVDPALTREAYQAAVDALELLEDEPAGMAPDQFADLFDGQADPADKDVEK